MTALLALLGAALLPPAAVGAFALATGETRRGLHLALARRARIFAPTIVVAGDSLAACCPFRRLCRRPFGVLSVARGGATLKEIAGQVAQTRDIAAQWLVVDGGLNDLLVDAAAADQVAEDFRALLRRLPPGRRTLFTLAPFTANRAETPRIRAANERIAALCAGAGVAVLDLNPQISADDARLPQMTDDGLHFSPAANAIWLEAVERIVASSPTHFRATKNSRG